MTILFIIDHLRERSDANVRIDLLLAKQLAEMNKVMCFVPAYGKKQIFAPYADIFEKVYYPENIPEHDWYEAFTENTSWYQLKGRAKKFMVLRHPAACIRRLTDKRFDYLKNRKALKNVLHELSPDVVIATGANYQHVRMLSEIPPSGERRILLELDPYTFNQVWPARTAQRRMRAERRWLFRMEAVFASRHFSEGLKAEVFPEGRDRIISIELPCIETDEVYDSHPIQLDDVSFVFAGGFYEGIRRPEYLLDLFVHLPDNYHLYLYSTGCDDVVDSYASQYPGKITHCDMVSLEALKQVYSRMDVLVNVSNTIQNTLPSKLVEAIGTGKPILNLSKTVEDISEDILKKYRAHITLTEDEEYLAANCRKLCEFVLQADSLKESRDNIFANYHDFTDTYVAGQIQETLNQWKVEG